MSESWSSLTKNPDAAPVVPWNWASAIPERVPRAELVAAKIPSQRLAQWAPELADGDIRLASTGRLRECSIVNVEGREITNYGELSEVVTGLQDVRDVAQVDYLERNQRVAAFELSVSELNRLTHSIAPEQSLLRVSDESNPWVLVRDGAVRCKVTARVERTRGLLHLVVSLCNCEASDQPILSPREITARCDGTQLHCTNVAETLDLMYRPDANEIEFGAERLSFAATSETTDYLIPTNYRRLEAGLQQRKLLAMPQPGMAALPGEIYPGPSLLGDARALSGFLLQRELLRPDQGEKTGWVVFAGEVLRAGSQIQVEIDLGSGPRKIDFVLP
ncbi:MAG: hypothetical protein AAGD07_10895 [Planctomycetota bacterium]